MFAEASSIAEREGQAGRKQAADLRVAALAPQLSTITVTVEAPVPTGLVVLRDGVELPQAVWATAVPLDPGRHVIEASAPGHDSWSKEIELGRAGAKVVVAVPSLRPRAASVPAPPAPASGGRGPAATRPEAAPDRSGEDPGAPIRVSGFVVGGLGLAGVVVGSVLGLMASSSNDESMGYCRTETFCSDEGIALRETAQDEATGSTVGFVAGGALLAAGLIMVLAAPSEAEAAAVAARAERWPLTPSAGPGDVGLGVATRW
jgi:hypothetical protein